MDKRKILIVRLGAIGDVIHTIPAAAALRDAYPDAFIAWLVEDKAAPLLTGNPLLDEVIVLPGRRTGGGDGQKQTKDYWQTYKILQSMRFDIALDFQGLVKSGFWARASGAGLRVGFSAAACRESANIFFTNRRISPPEGIHVIQKNLSLLQGLDIVSSRIRFEFPGDDGAASYVREQLDRLGLDAFILINPFAAWPTKCWPAAKFARLIERLTGELGYPCLILWGPGEKEAALEINRRAGSRGIVLFPTSIPELMALLRRTTLLIGGDTASLHMATALDVPVVGIYGPTSPWRNGPFKQDDLVAFREIECSHCYKRKCRKMTCFEEISVDEVFQLAARRLGDRKNSRAAPAGEA
jgi:lipopolysaccharide heptosyltransferase I